jgi:hypothetical protein
MCGFSATHRNSVKGCAQVVPGQLRSERASECTLSNVRFWTDEDANAAGVFTRLWRWRIYALAVIAIVIVIAVLLSRA